MLCEEDTGSLAQPHGGPHTLAGSSVLGHVNHNLQFFLNNIFSTNFLVATTNLLFGCQGRIELGRMRTVNTQHIAGKLNRGTLHAQTDACIELIMITK